ncbi:MAG: hydrogenase nickel incorporation protein HypB [bacterium]|nr:hydrogenase nickel incorporation protein HypB [bacterium]
MCQDCGCVETGAVTIEGGSGKPHSHGPHGHGHHHHAHGHHHHDPAPPGKVKELSLKAAILSQNDHLAAHNREHLKEQGIFTMNWVSAPGSGKTSLLERIVKDRPAGREVAVIEGDQQTTRDAERIRAQGAKAVQIETGSACHLDAQMVHQALHNLAPAQGSLLVIENVGNMVCPTAFDLGEDFKLAVISTPEGDDKPLKYPDLILNSKVLLINKIDLLPYLDFDLAACEANARKLNPQIQVFAVSAKTGEGLDSFYRWLDASMSA